MKRQGRTILATFLVLAFLAGVFSLLLHQKNKKPPELPTLAEQSEVFKMPVQIAVQPGEGKQYCLERTAEDQFTIQGYTSPLFRLDQNGLREAFSRAAEFENARRIDGAKSLDTYGLNLQKTSVRLTWENGEQEEYWLGQPSPFQDGYYVLRKSDEAVLLMGTEQSSLFLRDQTFYRYGELMPEWEEPAREIYSVSLRRGDACVFTCMLRDEKELDALVGQAYSRYKLCEPVEASTSTYRMEHKLLYPLANLTRAAVVEDNPESFSPYGLDQAELTLDVECGQGSVTLLVGRSEQGNTYVMMKHIPAVLSVPDSEIDFLRHLGYLDLINDFLWVHNRKEIASARITAGGEQHELLLNEQQAELDGKPISETNTTRLFLRLISVSIVGDDAALTSPPAETETVRFEMIHRNGTVYTLSFFYVDDRCYLADLNGEQTHLLVSARDVDSVLQGIHEIQEGQELSLS